MEYRGMYDNVIFRSTIKNIWRFWKTLDEKVKDLVYFNVIHI